MADLFQKCHHDLLEEVKRRDIYPYFHTLESRQAPVVEMEGKRRIMLGSNNYLGFTEDPVVIEAGHKALDKYGTGVSGSRFLNGTSVTRGICRGDTRRIRTVSGFRRSCCSKPE